MTSVTCQTAYVKCFQWSRCCSCTHVGGDSSLSAGPDCSASLCWPRSCTALAEIPNPGIGDPLWSGTTAGAGPQATPVADGSALFCYCTSGRTQENQDFRNPVFWHFFRTFPFLKELMYWAWLLRILQRKLNFHFKGQNTNLLKVIIWTVDQPAGGWRVYFKRLLSFICL